MKSSSPVQSVLATGALALLGVMPLAALAQVVKVDGSSTVYPITEVIAEDFQKSKKNAIKVTVGISGTGGGFKKFCRGETDVQDASRPILKSEMADCKSAGIDYIELPIAFDALTVVINPKNTFIKSLSVEQLKKMWEPTAQGKVMNWNQVDPSFPNAPLKLFGAGADSGTFDYFTEAINGKSKASRGDFTASEDDNVLVQGVSRDVNAIGYFGLAYYLENKDKLRAVPIIAGPGKPPVSPSEETVLAGNYQPLARPIFIYVNTKSLAKPEVKEFVNFYLTHGAKAAKEVQYVPLPAKAYEIGKGRLAGMKTGTIFAGHADVGVKFDDVLADSKLTTVAK
jgi:phosphate transport system substrate-binding protein